MVISRMPSGSWLSRSCRWVSAARSLTCGGSSTVRCGGSGQGAPGGTYRRSTALGRLSTARQRWAVAGTFRALMDGMITEAAVRRQVDLDLVSVDSTVSRAHHHAAGMVVDSELLDELEKAVAEEKGLHERGKAPRWLCRARTAMGWRARNVGVYGSDAEPGFERPNWAAHGVG